MRADLTYCDFLVLGPLRLEIAAILRSLEERGWSTKEVKLDHFPCVFEATFDDLEVAYFRRHAAIVQLNFQGVLNASVDTARVLELYEPGYVASYGIAGTFNEKDAPLGAVVFATQVLYYEPSKEKPNVTQSRMDRVDAGTTLLNRFRRVALPNVPLLDGLIASGEKLFADIDPEDQKKILTATHQEAVGRQRATQRERINADTDKGLAVEMEAAGVGRAVGRLSSPSTEFVAIKGISDLADVNKNLASDEEQTRNREIAAANAAACLVELMRDAPLRRVLRAIPTPSEAKLAQIARHEARQIMEILEPYGVTTNYSQLHACLHGRRGSIPAYFHWEQHNHALHWIDFKILTAMRALPREIVTPTAFVTIGHNGVRTDQPWYCDVHQLIGCTPITNIQIDDQLEELSTYFNRVGLTHRAEREIARELQYLRYTGKPEITLNLMRYMLGQFCHRRMFVFTWKSYRRKWEQLTQAIGLWFSIFEWDTMQLDGRGGKQERPGIDLLIEPGSYSSLNRWLSKSPPLKLVQEFLDHFKCHQTHLGPPQDGSKSDPRQQLLALMKCWDKVFFGLS